MRFLVSFLFFILLISCAKVTQDKDTCVNKEAKQNVAGQTLPVAISYTMPGSWLRSTELGEMVLEERIIDPISQAKLKVFYFEGMRNKNDANIERWTNQFQADSRTLISKELLQVNNLPVLEFIMSGVYLDKEDPMNPNSKVTLRPGSTMKAYIVETQTGTWFFKAVAPDNVMNIQESNFNSFLNSIKESY